MRNIKQLRKKLNDFINHATCFRSIYFVEVEAIDAEKPKPVTVKRKDATLDCYVTERAIELYKAGKLTAGDIVLIAFVDGDPNKPVIIDKLGGG